MSISFTGIGVWTLISLLATEGNPLNVNVNLVEQNCSAEFVMKNVGSQTLKGLRQAGLPWISPILTWVAVEGLTRPGRWLEPDTSIRDFSGGVPFDLAPAEEMRGSVELVRIFPGLSEPRKRDVIVFVFHECPAFMCGSPLRFTGSVIIPPSVKCSNPYKIHRETPNPRNAD